MRKILSMVRKACQDYNLISENDKIAVGVSGGKDSLMLLTSLCEMRRFYPKKYDVVAISVDMFNGETDYSNIANYCQKLGVEFIVKKSQIKEIVFDARKENNPCSLCAKLRRGILNSTAKENGCNKVALGHHKDDLIETFLLSLCYEGRLSTFMPITHLSNVDIDVIRPMMLLSESEISSVTKKLELPVLNNNCPANHKTEREHMKDILKYLKKEIPISKERIFSAIISPERYNLFDKFLKK